jgi:hypothetical protein
MGDHFLFEQRHGALPVLGAYLAVHLTPSGALRLVVNETQAALSPSPAATVSRDVALGLARRRVGVVSEAYHAEPRADLSVTREGRLVWRVLLPAEEPFGDWELLVDARNGEVVRVTDLVVSAIDGAGDIFDPNPVVTLQNESLTDQNDAPSAIPQGAYRHVGLPELDAPVGGLYYLRGPHCSIQDFELPMTVRATSAAADGFNYDRGDDRFEEVSVYYHVDAAIRSLRALGFLDILTHPIVCDAHGLDGADNSHYVPSTGRLAYGDGCIDDAEDAEVIWHELGHAVQDDQVPGWVGTGESGAMGEGFCDFFAAALSETVSNGYGIEQVFDWDRGPVDGCWAGRRIDSTKHYPDDLVGDVHSDGEIWSAVLWEIAQGIGRERALTVVIESHVMVPPGGSFEDGAVAVILADGALYAGADIPLMLDLFEQRGILSQAAFAPAIAHVPPPSTEDPIGPYVLTATVGNYAPIPPDSVRVLCRTAGGSFLSLPMEPTGIEDEYAVSFLGVPAGTTYEYYFRATDFAGLTTRLPVTDGTYFTFSVADDLTPPVITHTAIADAPYGTWPPTLSATVTDSHGVDSVTVSVSVNGEDRGVFDVPRVAGTDTYLRDLPLGASLVSPGDVVGYRLAASDVSVLRNTSFAPMPPLFNSFTVLDAGGRALVVDDDNATGTPVLSADLATAGFIVTTVTPGALTSAMLVGSDFVGWAAGNNPNPLAHAGARAIIEEHVAGGGKVVIEGGEVGYDALKVPGYPSFASNVLHAANWVSNWSGVVRPLPWKKTHPVLYVPNILPASVTVTYAGLQGNQDAVLPAVGATLLAENSIWPGYGGILVYDDDAAPQSGRVVYCAFNINALSDQNVRRNLVGNIGHYLAAGQGAPAGTISGTVNLLGGPADRSGTIVRSVLQDALTFTAADGTYSLSGLYSTPQMLEILHAGYETVQLVGLVPPENGVLAEQNAELRAVDTFSYRDAPYQAIPDNNTAGIQSIVNCTMDGTLHDILVSVVIHHGYVGDLIVELRSPTGRTVRLHNRTGKGDDNILTTFDSERVPDGPGTLDDLVGDSTLGDWTLTVSDNQQVETGTFDSWTLLVTSLRPTIGDPGPDSPPAVPGLELLAPNPFSASVRLSYALPRDGDVRLAIFDLTGREIAVIEDGRRESGRHETFWNARDREGRRVGAGVYFCRFTAGGVEETRKLVLLE